MSFWTILRDALREARGSRGRALFVIASLALGVAAVVGVESLSTTIRSAITANSRELLGADLVVEARRPMPPELDELTRRPGVERSDLREMATMAASPGGPGAPGRSRLCELQVVAGRYPFYGEIVLEPRGRVDEVLDPRTVVVAPEALEALGLSVGEDLLLGGEPFRIGAVVVEEPSRLGFSQVLGPRVIVSEEGLARTGLVGFGSRVRYRALFKVAGNPDRGELEDLAAWAEDRIPDAAWYEFKNHHDAQPTVREGVERMRRYLALVALLSLILGGVGVARIVGAWVAARTQAVAVLRCLGFRPREVLARYIGHVGLLALAGSALGALAGGFLPRLVPLLAPDVVPASWVSEFSFSAALGGVAYGTALAALFALPALTAIWRVSPARVLRADAEPLPAPRAIRLGSFLLLAVGVFGAAWRLGGELRLALGFTAGLGVVAGALHLGAKGLMRAVGSLPRHRLGPLLHHGFAALARPGAGTVGAVVALGVGVLAVSSVWLVERGLSRGLEDAVPADAPSAFLLDVQPEQWSGIESMLKDAGARGIVSMPLVGARLAAVDGRSVTDLLADQGEEGRRRWVLTREQRVSWREDFGDDNEILRGELWSDPEAAEVSVEERFARDLGVDLGSRITLDVQGVEVDLLVTSIRRVRWESFRINFFLVAEPGILDAAPHTRIAVARLEPDREELFQDRLVSSHPNVSLLRIRPIVDKVLEVLGQLALAVRVLGAFALAAGFAILAGAVSASGARRTAEAALLKTLGVTRGGVAALFAVEYALWGLVAGLVGTAGAALLAWLFLERVVDIETSLPWGVLLAAPLLSSVLAAVTGVAASARALTVRPIAALRSATS